VNIIPSRELDDAGRDLAEELEAIARKLDGRDRDVVLSAASKLREYAIAYVNLQRSLD
jgi:hypothetical protein